MRKLFILRGAMGSGKTTFIKEHHLEDYTLSTDQIRLMLNAPELSSDRREAIPQFNNQKVWELLYYFLEERMRHGELTIVDAMHAYKTNLTTYKKLAEKYRYRLFIVDFTDVSKEELIKRNAEREEAKMVPVSEIERVYHILQHETIPAYYKVLKPQEFTNYVANNPRNFANYENIHIFGDIHGCYTPLKDYFAQNPIKPQDAYIFLGDYFDRGQQNVLVFNFLQEIMAYDNTFLLMGNHEDKLYKYACDDPFKMDYGLMKTIEEFSAAGITKSAIRGFVKSLAQIIYFTFQGHEYLISHGGIPYFPNKPLDFYSANTFIYGGLAYEDDVDELYNNFMTQVAMPILQIHGHRNPKHNAYNAYPFSYNLEGDIENGGFLRILSLSQDGQNSCLELKNEDYDKNFNSHNAIFDLVTDLRKQKCINEKKLSNNISSFNFTREAFNYQQWNALTTKARGLFIDTLNYAIVARSYDKFFNINERVETKLAYLKDNMLYPIKGYKKYNGFLGLLSVYNDEFYFATKSTDEGDYVTYFKNIFYHVVAPEQYAKLKEKIKSENLTLVFEVIDPENDPHIIKYDEKELYLLDAIYNTLDYHHLPYEDLCALAKAIKIQVKEHCLTLTNSQELEAFYNQVMQDDYQYNNAFIEGFVLEDAGCTMVKIKTPYYQKWKRYRFQVEQMLANPTKFSSFKDDFLTFAYDKINQNPLTSFDIISWRDEFEKMTK